MSENSSILNVSQVYPNCDGPAKSISLTGNGPTSSPQDLSLLKLQEILPNWQTLEPAIAGFPVHFFKQVLGQQFTKN
jgi:hypothetical protein